MRKKLVLGLVLLLCVLAGRLIGSGPANRPLSETSPLPEEDATRATELPLGVACEVKVLQGQQVETLTGRICKVTPNWLVVEQQKEIVLKHADPMINQPPYVKKLFKNSGHSTERLVTATQMWVPRDKVALITFESYTGGTLQLEP